MRADEGIGRRVKRAIRLDGGRLTPTTTPGTLRAVVQRDPNGWADLEAEQLENLEKDDFENFCSDLLRYEAFERHEDPIIDGPAGRSVPDGGRDILLTIKNRPVLSKGNYQRKHYAQPLTEDAQVRTAYSCKSGKNWLDLALRDVQKRKTPGRTIEVLLQGGYFKLLINTIGMRDEAVIRTNVSGTPHAHLAAALWKRMKETNPDAGDPGSRIEILDAHDISGFLRARRPEGGSIERWAARLSLVPLLHGLDQWRVHHREDRNEPAFAEDAARTKLRDDLLAFVRRAGGNPRDRAVWLVGPPGIGKTRLILEALTSDPTVAQRARVALSSEEALNALDTQRLLIRHPSVVLIVDDCPVNQVDALASRFRAGCPPTSEACLLVITPASQHALTDVKLSPCWFLDALDAGSTSELAAGVLGALASAEEVRGIVQLSEGYPWFATLLAREARTEGRSPHDLREAAKWALASRSEAGTESELQTLRLRRARCLLAASLTRRIDWSRLSPSQREDVVRAVGLRHWEQDVMDVAMMCVRRGILRRTHGWQYKYVTPLVLEREVIAWLFDPNDGPDPGGRTLSQHGQAYLSDFFEALPRLGLSPKVVTGITRAGIEELAQATTDWDALRSADLLGARLMFMARHAPDETAHELRIRLERTSIAELRARVEERRGIMFALEELSTRLHAFDDAEASLFRLAQAENESYANNATSIWAGLFFIELNVTYRSLNERIELLERRISEADPVARMTALTGARAVLTTRAFRRVKDAIDGVRPATSPDDADRARVKTWALLATRFTDLDREVAAEAKRVALDELRGAVRSGIGHMAMATITEHLDHFTEADRVKLRDTLAAVREYDSGWLVPDDEYVQRLEELLVPKSFRQRLHQRVGAFGPVALRRNENALDDALAREGLAGEAPLQDELDWLLSDAAVRSHMFAYALGRCDEHGVLFPGLLVRARAWRKAWKGRIIFARYLGGWAEAGRSKAADAILEELRADPEDASLLVLAAIELGATDDRLGWIEAALRADQLDAACILELGRRRHWIKDVSDEVLARFVGVLLEGTLAPRAAAALEILVDHVNNRPDSSALLQPFVLRALERLAPERLDGMTDYYWELGAVLLIEQGNSARVAELAVIALSRPSGSSDHAWKALHCAAERDSLAAWHAVAAALAKREAGAGRLLLSFRFHRSSFLWPCENVLSWIGRDERRGRMIVSLLRPCGAQLDPIVRELVLRFGPQSSVANEIFARIESTDGVVASLADHDTRQIERARSWLNDPEPHIRAFTERLIDSLTKSHDEDAAHEEDERRRWGT